MFLSRFALNNVDLRLLKTSAIAFALAFIPPVFFEAVFGSYSLPVTVWIMIPVAFHEIGHLVFRVFSSALSTVQGLVFFSEALHYLGGFLFNGIAGLALLWFSLLLFSRINSGKLKESGRPMAFSFLFIAYLNLFMVPYTLTHLQHVVGPGLDFTMASGFLGISLEQLLAWLWIYAFIVLAMAVVVNAFFVFKKR